MLISLRANLSWRSDAALQLRRLGTQTLTPVAPAGLLSLAAIAAISAWLQSNTFVNHDVAWTLWGAGKMLHGAEFGRDIVEPNPPLIWFLSMPAAFVAEASGAAVENVFRLMVGALAFASLGATHLILRTRLEAAPLEAWCFTLIAAAFMLIFCYRDYGQREHLAQLLSLAYLAAAATRLAGRDLPRFGAALIGLAAAAGLGLKPYFLAVPAFVEVLILLRRRDFALLLRPELVAFAGALVTYIALVLYACPGYLGEVVPMTHRIYWGFDSSSTEVLARALSQLATLAIAAFLLARVHGATLPAVMVAASAGFACQYLMQKKGFSYHLFPLTASIALALVALASALSRQRLAWLATIALAALAITDAQVSVLTAEWYLDSRLGEGPFARQTATLIDVVNRYAAGGRFMAISTHPYPGFPLALHARSEWTLKSGNQIFLPAIVRLRTDDELNDADLLAFAEAKSRDFMLRSLSTRPAVVIVDDQARRLGIGAIPFDFLAFYREDPAFREAWTAYEEVERVNSYRIFVRRAADSWP